MEKTTTIPVKRNTKTEYDRERQDRKHDAFIRELVALYRSLDAVERARLLQQARRN